MRAVVYKGEFDVAVEDVPDAKILQAQDAIVRITTTNICGSDLHMYEGRTSVEAGKILGHENMGIIEEVGPGVNKVQVGDRVSVPFNIGCGTCRNCERGQTSFCLRANPADEMAGAAYGFAEMGPYDGGQAEYLRVPWADWNLLRLPPGTEHENDFTMLSDVFPTGWHGTVLAGMREGDSVVVYGAGPVGLMAAHSAVLRGASRVFVVDQHADRLALADTYGAIAVDYSKGDPVGQVLDATNGVGADCGVETVGYQAHDSHGNEAPALTLDSLVTSVRFTGGIGVVGLFLPADPGGKDDAAQNGRIGFDYGSFWLRGQRMGTGQAPVKAYNRQLRDLIVAGRATPGDIVSHEIGLDQAPEGYQNFDNREHGWTKVLLKPGV